MAIGGRRGDQTGNGVVAPRWSLGLALLIVLAVSGADVAVAAGKRPVGAVAAQTAASSTPAGKPAGNTSRSRTAAGNRSSRGTVQAGKSATKKVAAAQRRKTASRPAAPARQTAAQRAASARVSVGHAFGLHDVKDPLSLQSAVAFVVDGVNGDVLFEKNAHAVLPIASISKLMTAIVVLDSGLALNEMLEITQADVDTERFTRSRLRTGTRLTRDELLQLALMSSENRAAHALGRNYPGGMKAFVAQMNRKAAELGMTSSGFVEPTGLSSRNVSSARDLARLVRAAFGYEVIREYSTASALTVDTGYRLEEYRNTNRLVARDDWEIGVQKTGFISEAGNCVVMQARIGSRPVVLVLLDAEQRTARVRDSMKIRQWLESGGSGFRHAAQPKGTAARGAEGAQARQSV